MIKRIILSVLLLSVVLGGTLSLQSCDVKSPTENVKVILDAVAPKTPASVSFLDARTSALITPPIAVTIIGADKDKITDFGKNAKTSFTSSGGIVSFAVKDGSTFPINVTVVAILEGFVTTSVPVTITSSGGAYSIYMVDKSNPPAGVSFKSSTEGVTSTTGAVVSTFTVGTDYNSVIGASGKIRLPAGTIITDVTGTPLTGTLTTEVTYFNPTVETALRCFPGGFNAPEGYMYSAGFTSIEIRDGSGKSAKNFSSGSADITIEIPTNAVNNSGSIIPVGSTIPVFSYNVSTGANAGSWVLESGTNTVTATGNTGKSISFNATHLSYWNLDYYGNACSGLSRTVKLVPNGSTCSSVPLELRLYYVSGSTETYYRTIYVAASDSVINFYNAPNTTMRMKVYYNNGASAIGTSADITSLCAPGPDIVINYTLPFTPQSISGTVVGVCANNPNVEIRPTLPIYYRPTGSTNWMYLGYMVNGVLTGNCAAFGTYDFMSYYGSEMIIAPNVPINTNNITFTYTLPNCN